MQLINKAGKFLYLGCLILILSSLGRYISKPQGQLSWHPQQILVKLSQYWQSRSPSPQINNVPSLHGTRALVMEGGDPYIRALMRTITASEANVARPYNVIYGGKYVNDLSRHPEICVPIVVGPNIGNCTTAAGRYQMLDFTWSKQAKRYHPQPSGIWRWKTYSFEAEYQDAVVHDWLSDSQAWGTNIPQLLRQGEITQVLKLRSSTWTSLGYGIETNSMSTYLPRIYQNMLREELS
ncbi:glycoside hydrolase family protein [Pleurocapsales cyanobacterium LEGE 10410]|nr:glycoside hydrolase family protein [Pleurocapsales cyanobacterium LEGE 10410]